jgi:hypothetical protein
MVLTILEQPQSTTVASGSTASFYVSVSTTGIPQYEWRKVEPGNDKSIYTVVGTNTPSYETPELTTDSNNTRYYVYISQETPPFGFESVESELATLTVTGSSGPNIIVQPVNTAVTVGGDILFFIQVDNPVNVTYQWYKKENAIISEPVPIFGAVNNILRLTNLQLSDNGFSYFCEATLDGNTTRSLSVLLIVVDNVYTNISGPNNLENIPAESTITFSVDIQPGNSGSFKWFKGFFQEIVNGETPYGSVISGADTAVLQISNLNRFDRGSYTAQFTDNTNVGVYSKTATLTVAPNIVEQPQSAVSKVGEPAGSVVFNVVTNEPDDTRYQWRKNNVNIVDATSATYTINSTILGDDARTYTVNVSSIGGQGQITSSPAQLSVITGVTNPSPVQALSNISFQVFVANPTGATYKWYYRTGNLEPSIEIENSNSPIYTINGVTFDKNNYQYKCEVYQGVSNFASTEWLLLTVTQIPATVSYSNTGVVYNGNPQSVIVTTNPPNISQVTTYNGDTNLPVNANTYSLVTTLTDINYSGSGSGQFIINRAPQTIEISPNPIPDLTIGSSVTMTSTVTSGLPITYEALTPGVVSITDNVITGFGGGSTEITANQSGNSNYLPAAEQKTSVNVIVPAPVIIKSAAYANTLQIEWTPISGSSNWTATIQPSGSTPSYDLVKNQATFSNLTNGTTYTISLTYSLNGSTSLPATISLTPNVPAAPKNAVISVADNKRTFSVKFDRTSSTYNWFDINGVLKVDKFILNITPPFELPVNEKISQFIIYTNNSLNTETQFTEDSTSYIITYLENIKTLYLIGTNQITFPGREYLLTPYIGNIVGQSYIVKPSSYSLYYSITDSNAVSEATVNETESIDVYLGININKTIENNVATLTKVEWMLGDTILSTSNITYNPTLNRITVTTGSTSVIINTSSYYIPYRLNNINPSNWNIYARLTFIDGVTNTNNLQIALILYNEVFKQLQRTGNILPFGDIKLLSDKIDFEIPDNFFRNNSTLQTIAGTCIIQIGTDAFCNCTKLLSANFSNVRIINSNAFRGCSMLQAFTANSATQVGNYAFFVCEKIKSISLNSLIELKQFTFSGCSELETVNIQMLQSYSPGDIIGNSSFLLCSSLKSININILSNIFTQGTQNINRFLFGPDGPSSTVIQQLTYFIKDSNYNSTTVGYNLAFVSKVFNSLTVSTNTITNQFNDPQQSQSFIDQINNSYTPTGNTFVEELPDSVKNISIPMTQTQTTQLLSSVGGLAPLTGIKTIEMTIAARTPDIPPDISIPVRIPFSTDKTRGQYIVLTPNEKYLFFTDAPFRGNLVTYSGVYTFKPATFNIQYGHLESVNINPGTLFRIGESIPLIYNQGAFALAVFNIKFAFAGSIGFQYEDNTLFTEDSNFSVQFTNQSSTNNLWNAGARTIQKEDRTLAHGTFRNGALTSSELLRIKQARAGVVGVPGTNAIIGNGCCF